MAKVTIEQTGMITKQGSQYLLVIQKANWSKIDKMLNKKIDQEITFSTIE